MLSLVDSQNIKFNQLSPLNLAHNFEGETVNTITFRFEDLCAFFSRFPSRLMVGLISTDGEPPEHVHQPHIIIKRDGVVEREYHTFDEINGDICLDVFPEGKPLSRYVPRSSNDHRRSFDMVVDLEHDLHPNEELQVDPLLCRARFYFRNGELYSTNPFTNVLFAEVKTGKVCVDAPTEIATNAGLDVEIPDGGYAVLRFFNNTEDYVFQAGSDYVVEITNLAEAITGHHFKYSYKIARQQPEHMWYFASGERLGLPVPRIGGDGGCAIYKLGESFWEWLMGSSEESK
jgi:hypothetical protein